jgi:hypothetical protein
VKTFMTSAEAQVIVNSDITVDTTWTSNNVYDLHEQIYVRNNATLTIQAGTLIATTFSTTPGTGSGSLAVCRGSQIFVQGTAANPVIMTSTDDDFATWQALANRWGNLAIMGNAYISENDAALGNSPVPAATNEANMEGLNSGPSTDRYGGGDDNDDSGTISYLSLRYGGKVLALTNELNGLSLGGIGRDTDISFVEIMNNVDDGIEIWGGTVNLKNFSIWNIGDDSFDVDQGWRGKAQFGLIVQGYSVGAAQGSGIGDNAFETDGAENSDWQPVTTASIYNCTVIGQPLDGDHATAFRDGARVQYRNCIFMDLGERLVSFDNVDGDGGSGYGFNGTLSWPTTWTTNYNAVPAHANDFTTGTYATNYASQTSGKLNEITDSVFFRNLNGSAYTEATAQGVFNVGNNNVLIAGSDEEDAPIVSLVRGPQVTPFGSLDMVPVVGLDPRPRNAAVTSVGSAPNDGFFTPASYRGAFAPAPTASWLSGWTASYSFGFTPDPTVSDPYCTAGVSASGCTANLSSTGTASASAPTGFFVNASDVEGAKDGLYFFGTNGRQANSWGNGTSYQCVLPPVKRGGTLNGVGTNGACDGTFSQDLNARWTAKPNQNPGAGSFVQVQLWYRDPASTSNQTTSFSDALEFLVAP